MELYYKGSSGVPLFDLEYYAYRVGSYHYNWHSQVELLLVLKGSLEVCCNGVCHHLQEDDLIWMNPGEGHSTLAHERHTVAFVVHFSMDMLTVPAGIPRHLYVSYVSGPDNQSLTRALRYAAARLVQALDVPQPGREHQVLSTLFAALGEVAAKEEHLVEPQTSRFRSATQDPIKRIVKYIDKHYVRDISLTDLGEVGGYNASYVSQLFRKYMGITFYEYLTRVRLRQALIDLRDTDLSITDVAAKNGFADVRAFNRYFKGSFSKTPQSYRSNLSEEHREIDREFKKSYIDRTDTLVRQKIEKYLQHADINHDRLGARYEQALRRNAALEAFVASVRDSLPLMESEASIDLAE